MAGMDPNLYASTGSWAGMPNDMPSYGPPPGGDYREMPPSYAPSYGPPPGGYREMPPAYAPSYGPPQGGYREMPPAYGPPQGYGYGGPPQGGPGGGFVQTGPDRRVGGGMYEGAQPVNLYRSGGFPPRGYGAPMHEEPGMYSMPPQQPARQKFGVRFVSNSYPSTSTHHIRVLSVCTLTFAMLACTVVALVESLLSH